MDKSSGLLPFAYTSSGSPNELPLDTTPRERSVIDINASSLYHTRTGNEPKVKGPTLNFAPSLKRRMGESFNEQDDIKRRDLDFDRFDSEPTVVDEESEGIQPFDYDKFFRPKNMSIPPSSPLLDTNIVSEFDFSTNTNTFYTLPDSPQRGLMNNEEGKENSAVMRNFGIKSSQLSSEADFGIDRFNRFRNPSANQCPSTDKDFENLDYTNPQRKGFQKAKEIIQDAFENIETKIDLEGLHLNDLPDEIKDFDNLVIFDFDPSQSSYQLYLSHNNLRELPPSLFNFTKLNVLALRDNKLTKLPPLIKKLVCLKDLSIGTNRLEYLPQEILELPSLHSFKAGPNPFISVPKDAVPIKVVDKNETKVLKYISTVNYLSSKRGIPPLKVLCLNKVANYDVSYQETKNWKKFTPKIYHSLIAQAIINGKYNLHCSECKLTIVEPVAEAYEWWDILQNKDVPIKKEFCSERCANIWLKKLSYLDQE